LFRVPVVIATENRDKSCGLAAMQVVADRGRVTAGPFGITGRKLRMVPRAVYGA
jgi:hypothetical protein